jgi:predicted  nucleic acid-binding Zn-ribbon protein
MKATVKLQGGPCDGIVRELSLKELPAHLWARRCPECGGHVFQRQHPKSETYRKDEELEHYARYVFTDLNLAAPPAAEERAKATKEKVA